MDGTILDSGDLSNAQLENDSVQALDAKWDEVLSPITDRPADSIFESVYKMQIEKSEDLKHVMQVYAQETTFGDEKYDHCRLKLMAQRHLEQKTKDSHFEARN